MIRRQMVAVVAAAMLLPVAPAMAEEVGPNLEVPADPVPTAEPEVVEPGRQVSALVKADDGSLSVTSANNPAQLERKTSDEQVLAIDTPVKRYAAAVPTDDTGRDLQWGLNRLQAEDIHKYSTGAGVKVAVVDTGVNAKHPELKGQVLKGYNAITGKTGRPKDRHGHGTFLAGMIAAKVNGKGVEGLAPGAKILPVKVLDADGVGDSDDIARGIIWAVDNGADVINMSFAADSSNRVEAEAIDYARGAGVTLVAAGGNEGMRLKMFPADYPGVLGVGATDSDNSKASFSNRGSHIDVAAPGQGILSTGLSGYTWQSGTSMSTAYVSAVAALATSYSPGATGEPLQQQIAATAADIGTPGSDPETGAGVVDPGALFTQLGAPPRPGMVPDLQANGTPDGKIAVRFTPRAGVPYKVRFKAGRAAPASVAAGRQVAAGVGNGQPVTLEVTGKKPTKIYSLAVFTEGPGGPSRTIAAVRPLKWVMTPTSTVRRNVRQRLEAGVKVKGFGWVGGYRLQLATQRGGRKEQVRRFVPSADGPTGFLVRDMRWSFHYRFTLQAPGFWNAASPTNSQYIETTVTARRGSNVTGRVTPNKRPTEVWLQRQSGSDWKTVAKTTSKRNGKYSLPAKSGSLRVYVPADLWHGPASSGL